MPTLEISKPDQVVQVIDDKSGAVVYTLRIKGRTFRPKVFAKGAYTVRVGEGSELKTLKGVKTSAVRGVKLKVKL